MLTVMIENSGESVIFRCCGSLVAGKEASTLYNTVVSAGKKRVVVLDLRAVNRVDARGLGTLLLLKQWADRAGIRQQLIPSEPLQELLDMTRLHSMFEIRSCDTAPAAGLCAGSHQGGTIEQRGDRLRSSSAAD